MGGEGLAEIMIFFWAMRQLRKEFFSGVLFGIQETDFIELIFLYPV